MGEGRVFLRTRLNIVDLCLRLAGLVETQLRRYHQSYYGGP